MPKTRSLGVQPSPDTFQHALDALDVIGRWAWDAATDRVRSDAFVALLFNLLPEEAEDGVPLSSFVDGIHADDRDRVLALVRRSAQEGSTYLTEYRVNSIDGRTRWVLARGRFTSDADGRPLVGSGILVDISRMRMSEGTFNEAESVPEEAPLDRAADHAIAAQQSIAEMSDPALKVLADALLIALGRKLAQRAVQDRRRHMN
ncbi:PAS domain-containing protein [Methylobacterium mesophilicum SR1.6/6]|uniref:PAS domain-containing protein n=1 Tax=Methylobacterium mesophilicum SR1.6/6 TaxID=908290 RepID=A0A6B9FIF8_9HYPH|nr:PAS domain-containing protein [Methylobacterium mesophilicum]QGY02323.1 PAS domain-containing protein [Methylobacterium mesophilicum SR1.6/6]